MASVGSSIFGSGTSSTRMSRFPCQATAFMGLLSGSVLGAYPLEVTPNGRTAPNVLGALPLSGYGAAADHCGMGAAPPPIGHADFQLAGSAGPDPLAGPDVAYLA